jgi:imidazolonepropionase-like amidohydrolase
MPERSRPAAASRLSVVLVALLASPAVAADPPARFFANATIYTGVDASPIRGGFLFVRDGRVAAVGEMGKHPDIPAKTEIINLEGAVVIPGLVDTHSHIGIYPKPAVQAHQDGNEMSGPVQPGLRALDAIDPNDPGLKMALAGGVTTANIMPGSGNVIGGQTLYVKLRGGTVEAMRLVGRLEDGTEVVGGLKMANGENPKGYGRNRQQAPFTRMKIAALQREQFVKAKEYMAKKSPDRDLALEPLVEVLAKKRTVHFHCHRADDLMTAVRLAEEFGFELVLQHATEGYRVAEGLAKKKIPVSLTLVDSPGGKAETIGLLEENAAVLEKAGVTVAINTDDFITESRFYLRTGSIAVRGGMSEAAALKALTLTPARLMHLDHRVGSLEKGKDADFVILSGPPFSVYTKVGQTWIEGKKVFDAEDPKDRTYRDGGLWLPDPKMVPAIEASGRRKPAVPPAAKDATPDRNPKTLVVRAGRVHTAAGPPIEDGVIVVEGGKITAVGSAADVGVPPGAQVYRVAEVTPALIDPFTTAGLSGAWNISADQDQDEPSDPNQADLRALDGFNPNEPLLEFLRANGIAVVHATPGRQAILAGQSGVFRTDGTSAERAALKAPAAILVNLGESPKQAFAGKGPGTRMGVAGVVRRAFAEAQTYKAKASGGRQPPVDGDKKDGEKKQGADAPRSPKIEALLPALDGKVPVYFAAHRADDIQTALRIADEFRLKPVIALGSDSYLMAGELAKRKVPVVVHPTLQRPGASMETRHTFLGTAGVLAKAGVPVTLCSSHEGYVPKQRNLRTEAAYAAANGLGHAAAVRAVTLDAAKLLGIDEKHGSIEAGKAADLVLYDGDPFENTTHVTITILGGKVVYDRAEYLKLPFDRRILPLIDGGPGAGCCLGVW